MTPTELWLERLIAHPTISADTNLPLIAQLEAAIEARGGICQRFPDQTGTKTSLLARLGPEPGPDVEGGLMLSGHVDVVPVAGQDWTRPAFAMTRADGLLYGRGTTDMKGFIAAVMALVERTTPATLTKPLWLAISYDEEIGCVGVRPMIAEIAAQGIRPELIVVGEPTSMRLCLGHKGKMAFSVTARGTPRHSAEAPLALNALHVASDFIVALRDLQDEIAATGPREAGYSVPYATVHVGKLTAGTVVNLVPDRAEMLMECRMMAADDSRALAARIEKAGENALSHHLAAFPEAGLEIIQTGSYPGLATDPEAPAVRAFAACLPQGTPECRVSFGTEAGLFAQALDLPVVVCGPGDMAQGHRPDEFIAESQLAACDAMLSAAVDRFCR
ncbi:acetylornithine deacetylase [Paracoccus aminophilus]|uniref:Acetylornithine deacetylase n=1 Tax=Paracoccus aminophilus JCM 7686 TaxID=1367847 RepID=S5XNM6_PARAH|nr:acetylornithine deacetylase [Paracoccus aminophilus]AGT08934.1 acetylornithine deacetylase [Paracoccus aminophilus JCM 7686]